MVTYLQKLETALMRIFCTEYEVHGCYGYDDDDDGVDAHDDHYDYDWISDELVAAG